MADHLTLTLVDDIDTDPVIAHWLAGLDSPASRRTMASTARTVARIAQATPGSSLVDAEGLQVLRRAIVDGEGRDGKQRSVASANRLLSAVRGLIGAGAELGVIEPERARTLREAVKNVKGDDAQRKGRVVSEGDLLAIMRACAADPSPAGRRDAAIVGLLAATGMRRAELAGLTIDDINREAGEVSVVGKGRKRRIAHLVNGANAALDAWLAVRGTEPGPLFVGTTPRGGHLLQPHQAISGEVVARALTRRARAAGVAVPQPHDMRRTVATALVERHDLALAARVLGHAHVSTTALYDRRGDEAQRRAAEGLHVPYVEPDQQQIVDQP